MARPHIDETWVRTQEARVPALRYTQRKLHSIRALAYFGWVAFAIGLLAVFVAPRVVACPTVEAARKDAARGIDTPYTWGLPSVAAANLSERRAHASLAASRAVSQASYRWKAAWGWVGALVSALGFALLVPARRKRKALESELMLLQSCARLI